MEKCVELKVGRSSVKRTTKRTDKKMPAAVERGRALYPVSDLSAIPKGILNIRYTDARE